MKVLGSWIQKFKDLDKSNSNSSSRMHENEFFLKIVRRRREYFFWLSLHIISSSALWLIFFNSIFSDQSFYLNFMLATSALALQLWTIYLAPKSKLSSSSVSTENLRFYIDIYESTTHSERISNPLPTEEKISIINKSLEAVHHLRIRKLQHQFIFLFLSTILVGVSLKPDWFHWNRIFELASTNKTTLKILKGLNEENEKNSLYVLNPLSPLNLKLTSENVIEVRIHDDAFFSNDSPPVLKLEPIGKDSKDSVTELLLELEQNNSTNRSASIQLNLDRSVKIKVPNIWGEKDLATIQIERVYPPEVFVKILNLPINPEDGFDDTQNIQLQLNVESNTPLQEIALQITSSAKKYREIIHKIESAESKSLKTDYSLNLSPYMDQDSEQFEIVIEAIDRSSPVPLRGESERFVIKAFTAYGKHQQALSELKSVHEILKNLQSESKSKAQIWEELEKNEKNAYIKSERSPYFDFNDRMKIDRFSEQISEAIVSKDLILAMNVESDLGYFLLEHEAINQSERDRDFFGAIRNFSRLIDQSTPEKDNQKIVDNQKKLNEFLAERHALWTARVKQLSESNIPKPWKDIKAENYFKQKIQRAVTSFFSNQKPASQTQLTKLSEEYKIWIESLEEAEQKSAQEAMQNSKANLNQTLNQIKELQKRQNGIVNALDTQRNGQPIGGNSSNKNDQSISDSWPSIRAESSSIANATKELEAQMRSVFPQAAKRINFAEESMQKSIQAGNENNFEEAESFADMAGRLLRLASSDAQKQSEERKNRSRRTRLNSDQNYGKGTVLGGDIEISQKYTVDPKYREHIMDDVKTSILQSPEELTEKNKQELDYYLQKTLR